VASDLRISFADRSAQLDPLGGIYQNIAADTLALREVRPERCCWPVR
jgi:hypothetical protein